MFLEFMQAYILPTSFYVEFCYKKYCVILLFSVLEPPLELTSKGGNGITAMEEEEKEEEVEEACCVNSEEGNRHT